MGASQPFMYAAYPRDPRFHEKPFDPKAVTRACQNPKPRKPQPTGPLVSFNQHPDTFAVFRSSATNDPALGPRTRFLIKCLRRLQLGLRIIHLIAAVGVLFLFSIFKNVDDLTTWAVRIMQMIAIAHCVYAIFSLSRDITARTAASMSAYQLFAIGLDFLAIIAYVLGVIVTRAKSNAWSTVISNKHAMGKLVDAVYYTMMLGSCLHFLIIPSSAWLGWTFRFISLLPPDTTTLEDLVASRPRHKRNKSSISTGGHDDESFKRPWTQSDSRRNSTQQLPQPRTVPFMDTRVKPKTYSLDDKLPPLNLPDRQYQIQPGRASTESKSPTKSAYHRSFAGSSYKGGYAELPRAETDSTARDTRDHEHDGKRVRGYAEAETSVHSPRSEQDHHRMSAAIISGRTRHQTRGSKSYAALTQHDNAEDSVSKYSDYEDERRRRGRSDRSIIYHHPNPLRLNPTSPGHSDEHGKQAALRPGVPATVLDYGNPHASNDGERSSGLWEPERGKRISSIQPEDFFSVSNSQTLEDSISLIPIDNTRKVSGNDYASRYSAIPHDRQNASGKKNHTETPTSSGRNL